MILRLPEYYRKFSCIADKCSDNCCIGWEIDIDDNTADFYSNVSGDFGKRLKNSISFGETSSFILGKNERCPFLNEYNLCDIILTLGEDKLCCICSEHPRYFEWYGNIKEGGTGLCCEESARIILTFNKPFSFYEIEIPDEDSFYYNKCLYDFLFSVREKMIIYLQNINIPVYNAVIDIMEYAYEIQSCIDNEIYYTSVPIKHSDKPFSPDMNSILSFLLELEHIDSEWEPYISSLIGCCDEKNSFLPETEMYLRNIAVYFVWRYFMKSVYDNEVISKINLMAVSVFSLGFLFAQKKKENGTLSVEDCITIAKNYSKEIEYSEDNLSMLANAAYENKAFRFTR